MQKIKGIIDRFEGEKAVVLVSGKQMTFPKELFNDFSEGDSVAITVSGEKEDTEDSKKVAESLLRQIFNKE